MIDLATRAIACKHWRWMPGMGMWVRYKTGVAARGRFLYRDETYMHLLTYDDEAGRPMKRRRLISDWSEALPDLDDPATLGCLLALVRQAYGRMMYVRWWDNPQPDMSGQSRARCEVVDTLGRNRLAGARTFYPSEAEALVAALEAAP